jgi:predicted nucleic-acid-binding protein
MAPPLLDTNLLLRHITGDHPEQSPRATACLRCVEAGEQKVRVTDVVVFETVYTLERHYRQLKAKIRDNLLPLLELPGILLPGKRRLRRTFDLYVDLTFRSPTRTTRCCWKARRAPKSSALTVTSTGSLGSAGYNRNHQALAALSGRSEAPATELEASWYRCY